MSASDGGGARGALRGRGPAALPAGSDEAVEVPLTFDDNRLASLVFGQYDQNVAHIERRLHDPAFGPESLPAALRVSRSRLYAAFTGDEGVAAKIRDARLDRAYRRLRSRTSGTRIGSVMANCGFTDAAAFSRAFRRRFGMAPRDVLEGRF